jgi:hypothetical protein
MPDAAKESLVSPMLWLAPRNLSCYMTSDNNTLMQLIDSEHRRSDQDDGKRKSSETRQAFVLPATTCVVKSTQSPGPQHLKLPQATYVNPRAAQRPAHVSKISHPPQMRLPATHTATQGTGTCLRRKPLLAQPAR